MSRPVFTPTSFAWLGQRPTTHWFWDARLEAWSKTVFADPNHSPTCVAIFDGDNPSDRAVLLGSPDGYVRKIHPDSATDDGTSMVSYVVLGPFAANGARIILSEIQGTIDDGSAPILYEVVGGDTPESAFNKFEGTFVGDGTLTPGRTATHNPRVGGRFIYVKVGTASATSPWSMENIRLKFTTPTTSKSRAKD